MFAEAASCELQADPRKAATRSGVSFTSGAFRGDAPGAGGRAVAGHAGQAQDGLLIWHQRVQHLLREAAQRLGRGSGRALLRLHSAMMPGSRCFTVTYVQASGLRVAS